MDSAFVVGEPVQVNIDSHGSCVGRRGRRWVNQQFNISELAKVRLERA